jgi:integrase
MSVLTDTQIRKAKPQGKPFELSDARGLFLIVRPNGAKWWRFRYTFNGKRNLLSLGTYPDTPLRLACERCDEARRQIAAGIDPSAQRKADKAATVEVVEHTFAAVVERWKESELIANSDGYQKQVAGMLERDVLLYIGDKQITEIKPRDLIAVFDRIKERGAEETSRRTRTVVGQVFRYAIRRGIADIDPTQPLRGERRIKAVKHFAAFTDPDDVARLMRAIDAYKGTLVVSSALKLSALLFQRPGEIRHMQWTQLDLEACEWRYLVSKTQTPHIVPLSTQAVAILRKLEGVTGHGLNLRPDAPRYVFPTPKTRLRPLSENAVRQALRNLGFTNDEASAHGFRAMARSLLAEQGWPTDAIERQLAHKAAGPLGAAYDRAQFLPIRRRMMQSWADYLDALCEGRNSELRAA